MPTLSAAPQVSSAVQLLQPSDSDNRSVFVVNKPRLRAHTKSRKGWLACKARRVKVSLVCHAFIVTRDFETHAKCKQCSETLPTCVSCERFDLACAYSGSPATLPTPASDLKKIESLTISRKGSKNGEIEPPAIRDLDDCMSLSRVDLPEQTAVLESIHFFNTRLLPEIAPAHAPFQRVHIAAAGWLAAPRVMQASLVVITKAMQQSRSSSVPFINHMLLHYRGICLTELMTLVTNVDIGSQALAFDCIQLVMLAEMHLEPAGPWAYHLEAARRLIDLQGGLGSMFYKKSSLRNLLINYMEIDILTTTTCGLSLLNARDVDAQSSYIPLLAHREEETITTACFSPIPLLQAIVDTNKLRFRYSQSSSVPGDQSAGTLEFDRIHRSIAQFDPSPWATRILNYGSVLPRPAAALFFAEDDNAAMTSLALCHQAAAMIYLHLSCCPSTTNQQIDLPYLSSTHRTLTTNLRTLLARSSLDTEGPISTQLHKFVTWPLVIAAYASVGWDVSAVEDGLDGDAERDLERLKFAASAIGSRPLMLAASVLEKVRDRRAMRVEGGGAWGDAFTARRSFCVL
jgi:hypothetical protein